MKALITGANGLVGQKLIACLENKNVDFVATSRRTNEDLSIKALDITDRDAVLRIIKDTRPTVVINCAAMTQVDECEQQPEICQKTNSSAVNHLIEACHINQCHFIHLSTDFIFDGEK